jgi:hypothetical protein
VTSDGTNITSARPISEIDFTTIPAESSILPSTDLLPVICSPLERAIDGPSFVKPLFYYTFDNSNYETQDLGLMVKTNPSSSQSINFVIPGLPAVAPNFVMVTVTGVDPAEVPFLITVPQAHSLSATSVDTLLIPRVVLAGTDVTTVDLPDKSYLFVDASVTACSPLLFSASLPDGLDCSTFTAYTTMGTNASPAVSSVKGERTVVADGNGGDAHIQCLFKVDVAEFYLYFEGKGVDGIAQVNLQYYMPVTDSMIINPGQVLSFEHSSRNGVTLGTANDEDDIFAFFPSYGRVVAGLPTDSNRADVELIATLDPGTSVGLYDFVTCDHITLAIGAKAASVAASALPLWFLDELLVQTSVGISTYALTDSLATNHKFISVYYAVSGTGTLLPGLQYYSAAAAADFILTGARGASIITPTDRISVDANTFPYSSPTTAWAIYVPAGVTGARLVPRTGAISTSATLTENPDTGASIVYSSLPLSLPFLSQAVNSGNLGDLGLPNVPVASFSITAAGDASFALGLEEVQIPAALTVDATTSALITNATPYTGFGSSVGTFVPIALNSLASVVDGGEAIECTFAVADDVYCPSCDSTACTPLPPFQKKIDDCHIKVNVLAIVAAILAAILFVAAAGAGAWYWFVYRTPKSKPDQPDLEAAIDVDIDTTSVTHLVPPAGVPVPDVPAAASAPEIPVGDEPQLSPQDVAVDAPGYDAADPLTWQHRNVRSVAKRVVRLSEASPSARRLHFTKKVSAAAKGSAIYVGSTWFPLNAAGVAVLEDPSLERALAETGKPPGERTFANDSVTFLISIAPLLRSASRAGLLDASSVDMARAEFVHRAVLLAETAFLVADECANELALMEELYDRCVADISAGRAPAEVEAAILSFFTAFLGAPAPEEGDDYAHARPTQPIIGELGELTAALALA